MAILGTKEVFERIKNDNLVDGLGGRDLDNPEGVGVDVRLGAVHTISEGGAYIEADGEAGLGKRKGVETEELASFVEGADTQEEVVLEPGKYYLVQTQESVNIPDDLCMTVVPRSSLFRFGLILVSGKADPGYSGPLTFGLTNESPFPVTIQLGARFANLVFHEVQGESVGYRGQHQGGRISFGEETQV